MFIYIFFVNMSVEAGRDGEREREREREEEIILKQDIGTKEEKEKIEEKIKA